MPEPDDIALLRQYAEGRSESAFAALVEKYVNLVYSTALRSAGHTHAAEEITQAVFIILAQKARSLSPRTILSGWLYRATRLTAANFLRTEIRRQKREQEAYMQSLLNEPEPEVWPQIAPLLDAAMERLGDKDRSAIVLRFFENRNLREVGLALGTGEGAAKMRVNRALEKLRKFFTKRGVTLSAVAIAGAVSTHSVHAAPAVLAKSITAVAAAKGAAASGSTLTLVNGALKLMAWAKAKTAMVIGAGLLLAAGTTTFTVEEIVANRTLTIRIHVDGSDVLKVNGTQLWIEHDHYLLPNNPIFVNGTRWSPVWNGNVSAKFTGLSPAFNPHDPQRIKLEVAAGRGMVSIEQSPAPGNNQTLSVLIDDKDHDGPDWYEVRISW
jgi:RNA polymerase sigma factor (sigma-70 family)